MMDKFIIKIIIALLFFIIPNYSFLKEIKYQADGKLPLEFIYIINSYQNYNLNEEEKKSFKKTIYFYEQSFRKISKEEQFQLIKSQIYKNIINLFPISYKKKINVDIKEIKEKFEMRLESKMEDSFQKWLISALIRDINLSKKNKSLNQSGIYYSLFYNWNNFFNDSTVQDVDRTLKTLSKNISEVSFIVSATIPFLSFAFPFFMLFKASVSSAMVNSTTSALEQTVSMLVVHRLLYKDS